VVGDQSRRGEFGCGLSFTIDGAVTTDECGPIDYLVVGPNRTLRIHSGDRLTFRLSGSWTFRQWTVGWASETDAEAYRGTRPDSFTEKAREDSASGSSITVAGPPVGEWSIELGWRGVRGADDLQGRSYYRVVVEP
jgi:hypothetical protein